MVCIECKQDKDATGFSGTRGRPFRRCKTCRNARKRSVHSAARHRIATLRRRYGLTEAQIAALPSKCELCGSNTRRLHVDHNHVTGHVRGVLCTSCNLALGLLKDSPDLLLGAIKYLTERNQ